MDLSKPIRQKTENIPVTETAKARIPKSALERYLMVITCTAKLTTNAKILPPKSRIEPRKWLLFSVSDVVIGFADLRFC